MSIAFFVISYHFESEGVDIVDVFDAVLPRDETFDVDVKLIPDTHDGFIILLIPTEQHKPLITRKLQQYMDPMYFQLTKFELLRTISEKHIHRLMLIYIDSMFLTYWRGRC